LEKFSLFFIDDDDVADVYTYLVENSNLRYVYKDRIIPNMEVKFAKNRIDEDNLEKRKKIDMTGLDSILRQ
jgi:hypothetical protein